MGSTLSINQSNYQNVSNQISQISNEECINYVTNDTNIITNIKDSTFGNIEISEIALLNSPSCILKASLDSQLVNTLASSQTGDITDISGLFTFLDSLTGSADGINQDNYQNIVNESTQQMNSLCLNYAVTQGSIINNIEDSKARNLIITSNATSDKSKCVIDNMTKSYISNSEDNSQTAKITKMGILALLIIGIIVVAIVFVIVHHKKHGDADKNAESLNFGKDDTAELAKVLFNEK